MLNQLSKILKYLCVDGEWHTIEEIAEALGLEAKEVYKLLKKISEFHIVEFDGQDRVRVDPEFRRLPN